MAELPVSVTYDAMETALESIGLEVDRDVVSVTFTPRSISVVKVRRDDNGRLVAADDQIATTITQVGVTRG